jgi:cytochrome P450
VMGPSGGSIVSNLPFLDELPMPSFCKPWRAYGAGIKEGLDTLFDDVTAAALQNRQQGIPSWTAEMHESPARKQLEATRCTLPYTVGDLIEAGADTTLIGLMNVVFLALLNPDKMRRVQQELDRVVGPDRVPAFADLKDCLYLQAFVREVLRLRPPAPTGPPSTRL